VWILFFLHINKFCVCFCDLCLWKYLFHFTKFVCKVFYVAFFVCVPIYYFLNLYRVWVYFYFLCVWNSYTQKVLRLKNRQEATRAISADGDTLMSSSILVASAYDVKMDKLNDLELQILEKPLEGKYARFWQTHFDSTKPSFKINVKNFSFNLILIFINQTFFLPMNRTSPPQKNLFFVVFFEKNLFIRLRIYIQIELVLLISTVKSR
jgi:hypothetical protein